MLLIKKGVRLYGLQPEMLSALDVATDMFEAKGHDCIVTSGRGGKHSAHSHHYKGMAVDLRRRHVENKTDLREIVVNLKAALGTEYQVILETTHIHVEYDPLHATAYPVRKPVTDDEPQ